MKFYQKLPQPTVVTNKSQRTCQNRCHGCQALCKFQFPIVGNRKILISYFQWNPLYLSLCFKWHPQIKIFNTAPESFSVCFEFEKCVNILGQTISKNGLNQSFKFSHTLFCLISKLKLVLHASFNCATNFSTRIESSKLRLLMSKIRKSSFSAAMISKRSQQSLRSTSLSVVCVLLVLRLYC